VHCPETLILHILTGQFFPAVLVKLKNYEVQPGTQTFGGGIRGPASCDIQKRLEAGISSQRDIWQMRALLCNHTKQYIQNAGSGFSRLLA